MANEQWGGVTQVGTTPPPQSTPPPAAPPPPATAPAIGDFFPAGTKAPTASSGLFWKPAEWDGLLHLFLGNHGLVKLPKPWDENVEGSTSRAIVVFAEEGPQVFRDQEVTQKVLARQLAVQKNVVGRLGKGSGRENQNVPWVIQDPTPADLAYVNGWLTEHGEQRDGEIYLQDGVDTGDDF